MTLSAALNSLGWGEPLGPFENMGAALVHQVLEPPG